MATNTIKVPKTQTAATNRRNVFTLIENAMVFNRIFKNGLPVEFLPQILYVAFVLIFYIGNTHYAERTIRQIDKMKTEVDDLRADYTTLKADLMFSSKQSEVAKKVKEYGLEESSVPPSKIIIPKEK